MLRRSTTGRRWVPSQATSSVTPPDRSRKSPSETKSLHDGRSSQAAMASTTAVRPRSEPMVARNSLRGAILGLELVAHAPHRLEVARPLRIGLDLLAEPAD